jgi:hypothetical protein
MPTSASRHCLFCACQTSRGIVPLFQVWFHALFAFVSVVLAGAACGVGVAWCPLRRTPSSIEQEFQFAFRVEQNRDIEQERSGRLPSRVQRQWSIDLRHAYGRHKQEVAARSARMLWLLLRIGDCYLCLGETSKAHVIYHSYHDKCLECHDVVGAFLPAVTMGVCVVIR